MKNNPTLSRKIPNPKTTMPKNSGAYGVNPRARVTSQSGDGADFAFNGQMGDGVNRDSSRDRMCHNMYTIGDGALNQNVGRGPTVGNASSSVMHDRGPSATGAAPKKTMATAAQGHPVGSGMKMTSGFSNPDAINVGNKR